MLHRNIYSELGKLLYAVASFDGVITEKEKTRIHNIVKDILVPSEKYKDRFGTNVAFYIEMEFDLLDDQIVDTEEAFESFSTFIDENYMNLDQEMKHVCLRVVEEIAVLYSKSDKKEKSLIDKLKNKMVSMELTCSL